MQKDQKVLVEIKVLMVNKDLKVIPVLKDLKVVKDLKATQVAVVQKLSLIHISEPTRPY